MQLTAETPPLPTTLNATAPGVWMADRHWSAGAITADEFAMQAVGRVLLQDIATAPTKEFDATA